MAAPKAPPKPKRRKRSWRDIPDSVILALAPPTMGRAASLSPGPDVTWGCVLNDARCVAIVAEWQFAAPIRLEAISETNSLVFTA